VSSDGNHRINLGCTARRNVRGQHGDSGEHRHHLSGRRLYVPLAEPNNTPVTIDTVTRRGHFLSRQVLELSLGLPGRTLAVEAFIEADVERRHTSHGVPLQEEAARNADEVREQRALKLVAPAALPQDSQECLLDDVVAGVGAAHVHGVAIDRPLISPEQLRKSGLVSPARPLEQPVVIHAVD
jgi:hypothetical protein